MAVHYAGGGGGGLFGMLANAALSAIPGVGPYLAAGSSLLSGNPVGAATSIGGNLIGNAMQKPPNIQPNDSFTGALMRAHQNRMPSMPDIYSDPVTGRRY